MRIKYSPQRSDVPLSYSFNGEEITVTQANETDVFDFTGLPDNREANIESALVPCPVLEAKRENGELIVTLLKHHGPNAPESERFPNEEVL